MKGKKILVVDDEGFVRNICQRTLSKLGHQVTLSENFSEAQIKMNSMDFDLLLTDWMLPEGDGIEIIYQFNKVFPAAKSIIMTGLDFSPDALQKLDGVKPDNFLHKPFMLEELETAVKDVLKDT